MNETDIITMQKIHFMREINKDINKLPTRCDLIVVTDWIIIGVKSINLM